MFLIIRVHSNFSSLGTTGLTAFPALAVEALQHAAELMPEVPPIVLLHNGRHFDASVIPPEELLAYVASREAVVPYPG